MLFYCTYIFLTGEEVCVCVCGHARAHTACMHASITEVSCEPTQNMKSVFVSTYLLKTSWFSTVIEQLNNRNKISSHKHHFHVPKNNLSVNPDSCIFMPNTKTCLSALAYLKSTMRKKKLNTKLIQSYTARNSSVRSRISVTILAAISFIETDWFVSK